jgi:hypothetical protein
MERWGNVFVPLSGRRQGRTWTMDRTACIKMSSGWGLNGEVIVPMLEGRRSFASVLSSAIIAKLFSAKKP